MLGAFRILAALLFVLAIPVALVTTNIRYLANESRVYRYAVDEYDAVAKTGIDRAELLSAGAQLRHYFNDNEKEVNIRVMQDGQEVNLFNSRETAHLKDVKDRFRIMNRVQEFSVLYLIAYVAAVVLWAKEITPRRLAVQVIIGSLLTLAVIGGLGLISMAGFDSAWTDFHQLIFSNDFWRLNPDTDHLIQIYPPAFWQSIVFLMGLLVAAEAALVLIVSVLYLGATRQAGAQRLEPYYA